MARLPQIADTAQRGVLPSARLTSQGADAGDFGGQIGTALGQAGNALQGVSESIEALELARAEDQRRLRDFTIESNLVRFQSEEAERLAEESRNLSGGGWEFQRNFVTTYDQRAQEFMAANGITDEADVRRWSVPLSRLRSSLSGEALGAEFAERERYYVQDTAETLDLLRTGIVQDPARYDTDYARGLDIIRQSGMSAAAKETAEANWNQTAQATLGLSILENMGGYALLDALGEDAPEVVAPAGPADVSLAFEVLLVKEGGLGPNGEPLTSPAGARGIAQVMEATGPEAARLAGLPWDRERWLNDTAYNRALGQAYFANRVREFGGDVRKGWAAYNAGARWVREAEERAAAAEPGTPQADWFWQLNNDGRTAANRRQTQDYVEANDRLYAERSGQRAPGTPRERGEPDPRLQGLAFDARQRLVEAAERNIVQTQEAAVAAVQAQQAEALNALEVSLMDGTAGEAEIAQARSQGLLTDAADIRRLNGIVEDRARAVEANAMFAAAWADPNFAWNPYDPDQKEAVDAAYNQNPALLESIVARTGIVPPAAVTSIRGGLISNDPERVLQAARVASNAMKQNPNIFSAFEGADAIQQAGMAFDFYTETLGLNAEQAAQRLVRDNDPERQNQIRPNAERQREFGQIARAVPIGTILNAIPGGRARVRAPAQEEALRADYIALAEDNFRRFGDEAQARDAARRGIAAMYGVSANGTFTKFPPERIYPAVNGSHDYIYSQAAQTVRNAVEEPAGFSERNVILVPVPTLTAEAWRMNQPPPYQIAYTFEVDGQQVYDVLPGTYRFTPPASAPSRDMQTQFERRRERRQNMRDNPGRSLPGMPGVGGMVF